MPVHSAATDAAFASDLPAIAARLSLGTVPWLEGEHPHGTKLTVAQARHLGVVTARLHRALAGLPGTVLPRPLPAADSPRPTVESALAGCDRYLRLVQQIASPTAFDIEVAALIEERRNLIAGYAGQRPGDAAPEPAGWTHGDLQNRNLLWDGNEIVGILDWDRVGVRLWPLKFHYERGDPGCDHFLFSERHMVHWWHARRREVLQAFT